MDYQATSPRDRAQAAAGALLVTAALGCLLIYGLAGRMVRKDDSTLAMFDARADPPPPEKERPDPARNTRREGKAAPANLRSEPTEIVAPRPEIPLPALPPVAAAPVAGVGAAPSAGAADVPGPGTGAGGEGAGRGSGGDGDGDGGREADETPPRWRSGRLRFSDFPPALADAGIGGTVGVRYLVWTDGHVTECEVTRSSGNAQIDALTCRLITERFRFRPSRDSRGRPVPALVVETHTWDVPAPAPEQPPVRRRRFRF